MTGRFLVLFAALVTLSCASLAMAQAQPPLENQQSAPRAAPQNPPQNVTAYTLPPDLYRKAKGLSRIHFRDNLIGLFYGLAVLWFVLRWKLAPKYRDWAEKLSARPFLQALLFSPPLALTIVAAQLPLELYEHSVSRAYGISVEGWSAFMWDWTKGIFLLLLTGSFLVWILYAVILRSPRRWWLYFWLISLPLLVFVSFIEPFVIEPGCFSSSRRSWIRIRHWWRRSSASSGAPGSPFRRSACSG